MITWWGRVRWPGRMDPVHLARSKHLGGKGTRLARGKCCRLGLKHRRHWDVVVDCAQLKVGLPILIALYSLVGLVKELVSCRGLSVWGLDLSKDRRHR